MLKIGFDTCWVHLLMVCVRSVTYVVLINGQAHGHIAPSRGIRQGDPLSPYFFILCAKALSSLLQQAGRVGELTGIPISRGDIPVSHLLFADDSLIFCRANRLEWGRVHALLSIYEKASGQKVNQEKTGVFFSKNTKRDVQDQILQGTGLSATQQYERYLSLPDLIGRSRVSTFNELKGRIWKRIHGWQERFLTHAGKEILLKSVIQALPTYTMSVFRLPKTLNKEINSIMDKFWWGHMENTHKIPWMT
jgi:hypothetical protein